MAGIAFLGRGPKFPLQVNPSTGAMLMADGVDLVGDSIAIIIGTPRRSRVMVRDFGSGLAEYVLDQSDPGTIEDAKNDVETSIGLWERRLAFLRVAAFKNARNPNIIDVVAGYRVAITNQPGNVVFPVKAGGA